MKIIAQKMIELYLLALKVSPMKIMMLFLFLLAVTKI
jgi:hypothetical protein